jgi:hypothetical protein
VGSIGEPLAGAGPDRREQQRERDPHDAEEQRDAANQSQPWTSRSSGRARAARRRIAPSLSTRMPAVAQRFASSTTRW